MADASETAACAVHKLVADVTLRAGPDVLLVRYAESNRYDHQRGWFLPDDLLRHLEDPRAAAERILAAQLGLTRSALRLGTVESFRGRDETWHLVFHFIEELAARPVLRPSADLADARWFSLAALPPRGDVAHHGWALDVLRDLFGQWPSLAASAG